MLDNIVTADEAADEIGVTGDLVRKWIRIGKLPASRIGRSYVISRELWDPYARAYRFVKNGYMTETQ